MRILVTGGAGFIGSHFIEYFLKTYPQAEVTNVDLLTYAAHPDTPARLAKLGGDRYQFVQADIGAPEIAGVLEKRGIEAVINFAAESHVDRSILDPGAFVRTNVLSMQNLLQMTRLHGARFVQVSTDEVYGSLEPEDPQFTEETPLSPNSPYAASKAAADLMALAAFRTHHQDIVITRCTNNYGPYQFPEKLIPLLIANALENKSIPVYGDGQQVRDWIYVTDHARGVDFALQKGLSGEVYNFSSAAEKPNLNIVKSVLQMLEKPESLITFVGDRPGHDRRYGLSAAKSRRELGWAPLVSFEEGIALTVKWYAENREWWEKVRGKDYQKYYQANYAPKTDVTKEVNV